MEKAKTIFDHINNICYNKSKDYYKSLDDKEKRDFNIFMLQRFISMEPKYISLISFIDKYAFNCLDKEMYNNLLMNILPKEKKFFQYIKKDKKSEENELVISLLAEKLEISKKESKDLLQFLTEEEKQKFIESFGINEKPKKVKKMKD